MSEDSAGNLKQRPGPIERASWPSFIARRAGQGAALLLAASSLVVVSLAGATRAEAAVGDGPWTVRDLGGDAVVAGHSTARSTAQTLRSLMRSWGAPSRLVRPGGRNGTACLAFWSRPAVRVELANYFFRAGGATACSPRYGYIQHISTIGPRWRTDHGLRVGDGEPAVLTAYPDASDRHWHGLGRVWLLRPYETTCIGVCDSDTVLVSGVLAQVRGGVVTRFHAPVGAAGE